MTLSIVCQLSQVDTKTPFGQHSYYTVIDCIISEPDIHLFTVIIGVGIYMHSRPQIHVQAVGLWPQSWTWFAGHVSSLQISSAEAGVW